jgi:hypothetical protein
MPEQRKAKAHGHGRLVLNVPAGRQAPDFLKAQVARIEPCVPWMDGDQQLVDALTIRKLGHQPGQLGKLAQEAASVLSAVGQAGNLR